MTITCTIIKPGRTDEYGRPLTVGTSYSGADSFIKALYQTGFCTVTNANVFDDDNTPLGSTFVTETATIPAVKISTNTYGESILQASGSTINPFLAYKPVISQYDKALIFANTPRQFNAVRDFSMNISDAQYVGAITDAEVYETEAGALSVGISTAKALAFHEEKMRWDLSAGESLLIQARVKTVGATTSSNVLFGNSDGSVEGIGLVLYGPTHATTPGRLLLNYKGTGTGGQAFVLTPLIQDTTSVSLDTSTPTDAYFNLTLWIDGDRKEPTLWIDGKSSGQSTTAMNAGSTINPTPRNFGLGHIPADTTFASSTAKAARFQAFRYAVFPSSAQCVNVGLLDAKFNRDPYRFFSDVDYLGASA